MIVDLALAFLAGLLSFASTCVLPLVPAYVAYMGAASSGTTTTRRQQRDGGAGRAAAGGLLRRSWPALPDRRRPFRGAEPFARAGAWRLRRPKRGRGGLPDRHGSADLLQPADGLQRLLPGRGRHHAL